MGGCRFNARRQRTVQNMRTSHTVRIVPQTPASFLAGLTLYKSRPDKGYSLTDCISIETIRGEGLTKALTNDRHFEQEGFWRSHSAPCSEIPELIRRPSPLFTSQPPFRPASRYFVISLFPASTRNRGAAAESW
jgi:hypothetical protein